MRIARTPILLLVALCALAFAGPASARHHGGLGKGKGAMGPGHLEGLVAELGLDDETLAAVTAVLEESHQRRLEARPRMREAHARMRALMEAAEPDEDAILAQAEVLAELELEASKSRIRTLLRVRELLPPGAREDLVERMKQRGPRHGRRFEHGISGRRDRGREPGEGW